MPVSTSSQLGSNLEFSSNHRPLATDAEGLEATSRLEPLTSQLVGWQISLLESMFDEQLYLALNPDLKDLGQDRATLFEHFNLVGYLEQRTICREFDPLAYVALHDDVRNTKINPYLHYLRYGWIEVRETSIPRDKSINTALPTDSLKRLTTTRMVLSSGHSLTPNRSKDEPGDPYGLTEEAIGVLLARSERLSALEDQWNVLVGNTYEYEDKLVSLRQDLQSARSKLAETGLQQFELERTMRELQDQNSSLKARVDALERSRAVRIASRVRKLLHGSA